MFLDVIFEDDYIICVNKPNNVIVHHSFHSRNVSEELSLLQIIENQINLKTYPIHRLDRKTSGIILLAKKKEYVSDFQKLFTENSIEKIYFGLVRGFSPAAISIDSPVKGKDAKVYKNALTHLKTICNYELNIPVKPYNTSRYSLVDLRPKTGRMHQLRIHLNKISHPLIGDPKYGDKNHNIMFEHNFNLKNLFLHAGILEFTHPKTSIKMSLKALFTDDWVSLFSEFKWKNPLE